MYSTATSENTISTLSFDSEHAVPTAGTIAHLHANVAPRELPAFEGGRRRAPRSRAGENPARGGRR